MAFQKSFAVPGLPVFSIDISCLCIVDDLHFEIGDVLKSCLLFLDGIGQDMKLGGTRFCLFLQFLVVADVMLLQIEQHLGHLFYIEDLRPAFVTSALSFLHLPIDIDQKVKVPPVRPIRSISLSAMTFVFSGGICSCITDSAACVTGAFCE